MSRNLFRLRGSQSERLLRTYTAHRHAFDTHDIHVGDADVSEDRAEIRLMKIERRGRAIGKHAATRQRQDRALAGNKTLWPVRRVGKGASGANDVVNPRLER